MSGVRTAPLPGSPGPALTSAYEALSTARKAALLPHLVGSTSSRYIADWLKRAGHPVGATTIKRYRRTLADGSVKV